MKRNLLFLFVVTALMIGCNSAKEKESETPSLGIQQATQYDLKGYRFEDKDLASSNELLDAYKQMKVGDTMEMKVKAKVNSVCQKKGCWMRLDLGEETESFVRFLDYGFFMPMDLAGTEVLVNGKAYVEETSVEDLKHYAQDAGKSQEEIDAITEPELSYNFLSTGVLIPLEDSK